MQGTGMVALLQRGDTIFGYAAGKLCVQKSRVPAHSVVKRKNTLGSGNSDTLQRGRQGFKKIAIHHLLFKVYIASRVGFYPGNAIEHIEFDPPFQRIGCIGADESCGGAYRVWDRAGHGSCLLDLHVVYEVDTPFTHFAVIMSRAGLSPVFYTVLQRRLHWVVIVILLVQYLLQGPMRDALAAIEQGETLGFVQFLVTTTHTWGGISIAAIMLWRWQLRKRAVPLNGGRMSQRLQRWVTIHHASMYVTVGVMAASGAMHYYLNLGFAARWHELGKWLLLALVVIHVIGALLHARDGGMVLRRMMGKSDLR